MSLSFDHRKQDQVAPLNMDKDSKILRENGDGEVKMESGAGGSPGLNQHEEREFALSIGRL